MIVYTKNGEAITLLEPELAAGGEGSIYLIDGYHMVAKIYKDSTTAMARKEKIEAMVQACMDYDLEEVGLTEQIAWPMAALYDQRGAFSGFGMVHMSGHLDLDSMYVYPPIKNANITLKDKVDVLIDLCELIHIVHLMGQVFGDFNPDNIKINSDNSVCFMDADSFHIQLYGKLHKCIVCAPGYVAPEVAIAARGSTYADCPGPTFTQYSDYFALAIHVFRMLRNGAHPFVPQYDMDALGSLPAPEPIDMRVTAGASPLYNPRPFETVPAFVPDDSGFPPYLRQMFETVFSTHLFHPQKRPTAVDWKQALERYRSELVCCKKDPTHYYWKGAAECPYCAAEKKTQAAVTKAAASSKPVRNIPLAPPKASGAASSNPRFSGTGYNPASGGARSNPSSGGAGNYLGNGQYYATKNKLVKRFNGVTTFIAFILQTILGATMYQNLYSGMLDHGWAVALSVFGSFLFGMLGLYLHNHHITENRCPRAGDYITALLASFAMSLVFVPIALLLPLIFGMVAGIAKGIFIFIVACIIIGAIIKA